MAIWRNHYWAICVILVATIAWASAIPTSPLGITPIGTATFTSGAVPSVAVPSAGGYFFVYNGQQLLRVRRQKTLFSLFRKFCSISPLTPLVMDLQYDTATVNLLGTQSLPSLLTYSFIGGRIQYQKSSDLVFICSGGGVGLTAASGLEPITIIWEAPASAEVASCSVREA